MGQLPDAYERIDVPSDRPWHAWVLSDHYEQDRVATGPRRTYLGEVVYRAKYRYDRRAMDDLRTAIRHCVLQLRALPPRTDSLSSVTAVAAVPCRPHKPVSIPHEIAAIAADVLHVRDISADVVKTSVTGAAKTTPALHPDAYEINRPLRCERVLLVDDLYHTGSTLESVAIRIRAAGAVHVVGLCVTKVHGGLSP